MNVRPVWFGRRDSLLRRFSIVHWCTFWCLLQHFTDANLPLSFDEEPSSVMMESSDKRAVFRCSVNQPNADIKWLWNGRHVEQAKPYHLRLRTRRQKLTVRLLRKEKHSSHNNHRHSSQPSESDQFQCIAYHQGMALVSRPAKLIVGELQPFPPANDVKLSVVAGNTAIIPCNPPYGNPQVVTEFTFNGTKIDYSGKYQRQPSGDLQIFNTQLSDTGIYRCSAYNPLTDQQVQAKHKVLLTVTNNRLSVPPNFTVAPNVTVSVVMGSNVTLECVATGVPPPNITWLKKGSQLHKRQHSQAGGNLLLTAVRREDEGIYTCVASNGIGSEAVRSTTLEVQEVPQIIKFSDDREIEEGKSLTLQCITKGQPKPEIHWFHNGIQIVKGPWIILKNDMLMIKRTSQKHSGIYQCFATNQLDTTWASCVVTVIMGNGTTSHYDAFYDSYTDSTEGHFPNYSDDEEDDTENLERKFSLSEVMLVPPSKPNLTPLSDDSVMVQWNVPKNDGLPILFFKVQYKESGGHWMTVDEDIAPHIHSYAITELQPGASYRFRIAAVYSNNDNKHGPSSLYTLLKDPPMRKPVIGPIIVHAEAESPSAITIQWQYRDIDAVPIEGYFIHYRTTHSAGDYNKVTALGSNTRSHTITHLLPDTSYDIKMQCFNAAGTSDFSNILNAKTSPSAILDVTTDGYLAGQNGNRGNYNDIGNIDGSLQGNQLLYLILGIVLGVMLLVLFVFLILCIIKQRQQRSLARGDHIEVQGKPTSNGHVITGNGHIPGHERINVSINPLSEINTDESGKSLELNEIPSNNNEFMLRNTLNNSSDSRDEVETLLGKPSDKETSFISSDQS